MKSKNRRENVQPRTGQTHGLFGIKFLKYHNMRDPNWTSEDLVTQYEKLSNIFRKANKNEGLQRDQDEKRTVEDYKRMKKEVKDKHELLHSLLKGDIQRTKNVLQDHPLYQRTYQNKQSYEVLQELTYQAFQKRKKLDLYLNERRDLMKQYEEDLMEVAFKQEMIRYYDVKEFKEEKDTKRLLVELKNSETRSRAVQKINATYKKIIDELLSNSLYYQPVLGALNCDWNEQTMLVRQTYEIGFPAIQNVKKLEKDLKKLHKVSKKEENQRLLKIAEYGKIVKKQPKIVKELVRRDSDFSILVTRYDRDTISMTNLKVQDENIGSTIKMLMSATLCNVAEEIYSRVEQQPELNKQMRQQMDKREKIRNSINEKDEIAKLVHELLLDDLPQIYNDEKLNEIMTLENSIKAENDKQKTHLDHMGKRNELLMLLRLALQHMLDVLRHVESTQDAFKSLEFTTEDLKLPLLKFNSNLPSPPLVMETNASKLLTLVKTRVQLLMQYLKKESNRNVGNEITSKFQHAMIEDSVRTFLPPKPSLDFD